MNLIGPTRFRVRYTPDTKAITCERGTAKFSGEMAGNTPKLYIFSRKGVPIYIGATIRPMASRLNHGWKAEGKGGFWGYSFRHEGSEVDLDVWFDADPMRPQSWKAKLKRYRNCRSGGCLFVSPSNGKVARISD